MEKLNTFILTSLKNVKRDYSTSAVVIGLIATLVSYAGPLLIVFQAAKVAHLSEGLVSSWIWAISFGSGLTCILLSLWFKAPIITAFSTPGAVLLVSSWSTYSYSEAIGAFIVSAVIITILGVTGLFSNIMKKIPQSITTAMLAGILLHFGINVFTSLGKLPFVVIPMIVFYLFSKRWIPRYAVIVSLLTGLFTAYLAHELHFHNVHINFVHPIITVPSFSINALIGIGIPLCIVTMASQNAPGISVLRADGYQTPVSPLITATGLSSLVFAPFGSHGINLAAITAAICTGKEAHANPDKRYIAGISCGIFYLIFGIFGATIVSLFAAFALELIAGIAGIALFGSLSSSLSVSMQGDKKESALITFLVTASGVSIFGIGSAFWGLIAGLFVDWILFGKMRNLHFRQQKQELKL
ncbi:benzoate/H(+) symporter BenE family transporter [Bacillus sp. 03113]|uniref:benzoate/H(+) symporter BenE family transporter n=1 Tax=Bacillus sp. 03113 TaxID=2578211 RepID=UPI00114458BF|nr:benzoate/H(+) symporter BenE family transporter [Bacillus sp. 03113]